MEDCFKDAKLNLINKNHIISIFIILLTLYKESFQGYFDSFSPIDLYDSGMLVEVRDYKNQYLIVTTDKSIYTGLNPVKISTTTAKLLVTSYGATYNESIILFACLDDSLLSRVNITSGEEEKMLGYGILDIYSYYSLCSCSLSIDNEIAYLALSYETQSYYSYPFINKIIKINVHDVQNNGYDRYTVFTFYNNIVSDFSCGYQISCETIFNKLVCALVCKRYYDYWYDSEVYGVYGIIINDYFNDLEGRPKNITEFSYKPYIKLHKIDDKTGRITMNTLCYDIKVITDGLIHTLDSSTLPPFIYYYYSYDNLFDYNNNHIFYVNKSDDYYYFDIKKNTGSSYLRVGNLETPIKIIGYWDDNTDEYLYVYQSSAGIKYFKIANLSSFFEIPTHNTVKEIVSNQSFSVNVSDIIDSTYPYPDYKLSLYKTVYYKSTTEHITSNFPVNSFDFDYENQIVNIGPSDNNWFSFQFSFKQTVSSCEINLIIDAILFIETCKYNCKRCEEFNVCNGCKVNFTMLADIDGECYPIDQNILEYTYDKDTKLFEKCHKNCLFCYKKNSSSSDFEHNCYICKEGYERSYTYQGNCYEINGLIDSKYTKVVKNKNDISYTEVSSCYDYNTSLLYKIENTGECISSCPTFSYYQYYIEDQSVDIKNQNYTKLSLKYILYQEYIPSYLYGNLCYQWCPTNTEYDTGKKICVCKYTWSQNKTTKEITCNGEGSNCPDKKVYKYLIPENKECVEKCPDDYFRYNFICYKTCPNFTYVDENNALCKCSYTWHNDTELDEINCYVDKSTCINESYKYLLEDTRECIKKNCTDNYYRYNYICYKQCPDYTTLDSANKVCKCKYAWNYEDDTKYVVNCYNRKYICNLTTDYKYLLEETKECLKQCPDNYYTFGSKCKKSCPTNTITDDEKMKCNCHHAWHIDLATGEVNCYATEDKCIYSEYNYILIDTNECVQNNCPNNYYTYNHTCYVNCPDYTEIDEENKICKCKYAYNIDENQNNEIDCYNGKDICIKDEYKYLTVDTKECVKDGCPTNLYKLGYRCYSSCPQYSSTDTTNKKCTCLNAWHNDTSNKEIVCYSNLNCEYENYEYFVEDTNECTGKCPNNYYEYNYYCYKNGCPSNTEAFSDNKYRCKTICASGYYPKEGTTECINQTPDKYYFDEDNKIYAKCEIQCSKCDYYGSKFNACLECNSVLQYYSKESITQNYYSCFKCEGDNVKKVNDECVIVCKNKYYISSDDSTVQCLGDDTKCPEAYPFQNNKNQNECLQTCGYELQIDGLCKIDTITPEAVEKTLKELKDAIAKGDESISENSSKGDGILISGNGITLQIITSDALKNSDNKNVSSIDLRECENLLKSKYNIDTILFLKTDVKSEAAKSTSVQYELYHPTEGYKLDTSICADCKIQIDVPVDLDNGTKGLYDDLIDQGYDVFNSEDDFYNDICSTFSSANGTDVIMNDRKSDYYSENYTFCQEGCNYSSYNPDTEKVSCECNVNNTIDTQNIGNEIFDAILSPSFYNPIKNSNLKVVVCYKLVFSLKGLKSNIGGMIMIVIMVISLILAIAYYITERKRVAKILNNILDYKRKEFKINLSKKIILKKQRQLKNLKKKEVKKMPDSNNNYVLSEAKNINDINAPPKKDSIKSVFRYDQRRRGNENQQNTLNNNNEEQKEYYNYNNIPNNRNIGYPINNNNINNNNNMNREFYERENIMNENNNIDNNKNRYSYKTLNSASYSQNSNNFDNNNFYSRIITINTFDDQSSNFQPIQSSGRNNQYGNVNIVTKSKFYDQSNPKQNFRQGENFPQNENDNILRKNYSLNYENMPEYCKNDNYNNMKYNNCIMAKKTPIMTTTNSERQQDQVTVRSKSSDKNVFPLKYLKTKYVIYNEIELNGMDYEDAIIYDKRPFLQVYWSMLKSKQLILFTFFNNGDYNLITIKICLFLFSFSLSFAVNAMFFDDDSMHKIYEDNGGFDFIYQIPQVIYSTVVSSIAQFLIEFLSLSREDILQIKAADKMQDIFSDAKKKYRCLVIKFHLFFLVLFIFNFGFWYLVACFCAVYKNTQMPLIKDTVVSFVLGLFYPFGTCLLITLLRRIALNDEKKDKKCLFKISQFIG